MKTRTLLIDASYLLKRSFHGAKDTYNSKGIHMGALYQFLTVTRKLITEHAVNKVVIIWDGEQGGTKNGACRPHRIHASQSNGSRYPCFQSCKAHRISR